VKISELQVRLQPTTPPKVREKDKYLKAASKGISNTVEDYEKLLNDTMWIYTSLQEDPNIQKVNE